MQEYLTKEEIRQWRSSLEKITLEEYAARLGKVIQGEKHTNDMIDKVMTTSLHSMSATPDYTVHTEKLETLTLHSMFENREAKAKKETPVKPKAKVEPAKKEEVKTQKAVKAVKTVKEVAKENKTENKPTVSIENITFKKPLIPREQMIFDYLVQNKGTIVYAKDMAALLELPRDYVYKYIKNLRQKINEDVLFNADNGGYVLEI
ncbi:MAG: hypothetical protein Q4E87_08825 [bacterium]|nr:hypothetical protein [bacterium]